jgi:tRNA-specific 2-thiouridylase
LGSGKVLIAVTHLPCIGKSKRNTLIVGSVEELGQDELIAGKVNWISIEIPDRPIEANVKIRYRAEEVAGIVTPLLDQKVHIKFPTKLRDITPGQAAVFYADQVCLGGGIIQSN